MQPLDVLLGSLKQTSKIKVIKVTQKVAATPSNVASASNDDSSGSDDDNADGDEESEPAAAIELEMSIELYPPHEDSRFLPQFILELIKAPVSIVMGLAIGVALSYIT